MKSPALTLESSSVPGSIWLKDIALDAGASSFGLLCLQNFPALRKWRYNHVYDPFWRLYYNFTTGAHIRHDGNRFDLRPGHFVIVPANVIYETYLTTPTVDHFFVHFTTGPTLSFSYHSPFSLRASSLTLQMATALAAETRRKAPDRLACYHGSMALLHSVLAVPFSNAPIIPQRPEITRLLHKIESDPTAFIDATEMAHFAGMSLRNLQRHFQSVTGKSPSAYLNETRLREAARRLVDTEASIDQISDQLGFANRFHFSRIFADFSGSPPAVFRRKRLRRV